MEKLSFKKLNKLLKNHTVVDQCRKYIKIIAFIVIKNNWFRNILNFTDWEEGHSKFNNYLLITSCKQSTIGCLEEIQICSVWSFRFQLYIVELTICCLKISFRHVKDFFLFQINGISIICEPEFIRIGVRVLKDWLVLCIFAEAITTYYIA